ncbi:MAG: hypothetical protein JRN08_03845 [Nitrososphaerota archaeon]|nr:hypothetical protein [Nitrososphaerota archaeon]
MSLPKWVRTGTSVATIFLLLAVALTTASPGPARAQLTLQSGGDSFVWADGYALVQHRIPAGNAEPWSITTDPQGNVWFVEQGTNQLGEYDPASGNFTQYPIPTNHSNPDAVASDTHGNIWFVELTSNKLGELPAGRASIAEYPIPGETVALDASTQAVQCGPGAVLADPSGDIWVACLFSNQIDEFNPATDTFSSFDLPVFQSAPAGMALDGKGNLWFTAADSDMLGRAVISQLQNGTSQGITEFAPLNQTYVFAFTHPTSFVGTTEIINSSIRTPSGIALSPSGKLWLTEHVDSSFDSYDPNTQSLVKYWTSQTFGALGYSVTFPNGIAVDSNGTVWIGEHYGNRIAAFIPSSGVMTEYPVACCDTAIAGVYSVTLDRNGRLWFVEIGGDAIGEVVPIQSPTRLSLTLPDSYLTVGARGKVTVPLSFYQAAGNSTTLSLSVSGVTITGQLRNMTAAFNSSAVTLAPGSRATSGLTLSLGGLNPGVYYLTLSATAQGGVIYSAILKLIVTPGAPFPVWIVVSVAAASVAAAGLGLLLARRSRAVRGRRRALRVSRKRARTSTTTPTPVAA